MSQGEKVKVRNIGIDVEPPSRTCDDPHCPFHGKLPVRGKIFEGVVVSDKMQKTVVIKADYFVYVSKYKRYMKKSGRISAHNPPCLDVKVGDKVRAMECRPLSKSVSFVVIEKRD